jgi:hypothetical protein
MGYAVGTPYHKGMLVRIGSMCYYSITLLFAGAMFFKVLQTVKTAMHNFRLMVKVGLW